MFNFRYIYIDRYRCIYLYVETFKMCCFLIMINLLYIHRYMYIIYNIIY